MRYYLISSISIYHNICVTATGKEATLRNMTTPFIEEDQQRALAKAPVAKSPCIDCDGCGHTFPDDNTYKYAGYDQIKKKHEAPKKNAKTKTEWQQEINSGEEYAVDSDDDGETVKRARHKAASPVLNENMYAARMANPDVLRPPRPDLHHTSPTGAHTETNNCIA